MCNFLKENSCFVKTVCFTEKNFITIAVNIIYIHMFYKLSVSQNWLWACVEQFQTLCQSIEPQICQADPDGGGLAALFLLIDQCQKLETGLSGAYFLTAGLPLSLLS